MELACLDLEGVLVPEIWIELAERTGIDALKATTRDILNYDTLMQQRLRLLEEHDLGLPQIQQVVAEMRPLHGAIEFLNWLREHFQVIILSDTFYEFSQPLMRQLGWPTLFCNSLKVDGHGKILSYCLRQKDQKRQAVLALQTIYYRTIAIGDSYNDVSMLHQADAGILFKAPQSVIDIAHLPTAHNYQQLKQQVIKASNRQLSSACQHSSSH